MYCNDATVEECTCALAHDGKDAAKDHTRICGSDNRKIGVNLRLLKRNRLILRGSMVVDQMGL